MSRMKKRQPPIEPPAGPWADVRATSGFNYRYVTAVFDGMMPVDRVEAAARAVRATPQLLAAARSIVESCRGRVPADSTDSVSVEAYHVLRLEAALRTAGLLED